MEENKLLRWIDNVYNGKINEEIVIVNFIYNEQITKINEPIFFNNLKINKFKHISSEKNLHEKNCIYYAELIKYKDIKYLVDSGIKIIFLEYPIYKLFTNDINNKTLKIMIIFLLKKLILKKLYIIKKLKKLFKQNTWIYPLF